MMTLLNTRIEVPELIKEGDRYFVPTGEYRLPKKGDWFMPEGGDYGVLVMHASSDQQWERAIYREVKCMVHAG
jgi:hypothetical protein